MPTHDIVQGFRNSQKFRFILTARSGEDIAMVMTIRQMSDQFVSANAWAAIYSALLKLSSDRRLAAHRGETLPSGLVTEAQGFHQVQIDLH